MATRAVCETALDTEAMAVALAAASKAVAARINEGATLWCVAPGLDDHARHLAVEFVHPSSVGARSVPAVALPTVPDVALVDAVRSAARPGDVLLTLGDGDVPVVVELGARAPAWGVSHVHIGWSTGTAHLSGSTLVVELATEPDSDRFLTRAYHLLWELTFVLLRTPTTIDREMSATPSCAVCSDGASLAEVETVIGLDCARVRTACGSLVVDVSLVPPVQCHDLLLVHAGTALRIVLAPGSA